MSIYKQKIPQTIIRHPSRDKELEKMPIDRVKNLAIACFKIIETPTQKLFELFKEAYDSKTHDIKEWVQLYKLARFEKMMELKRTDPNLFNLKGRM